MSTKIRKVKSREEEEDDGTIVTKNSSTSNEHKQENPSKKKQKSKKHSQQESEEPEAEEAEHRTKRSRSTFSENTEEKDSSTKNSVDNEEQNNDAHVDTAEQNNIRHLSSVQVALQQLRPAASQREWSHRKRSESMQRESRGNVQETGKQVAKSDANPEEDKSQVKSIFSSTKSNEIDIDDNFVELGIDLRLANCLKKEFKFKSLFQLQEFAIKTIIQHSDRDVCISAPTGSGKTIMYAIPLVHSLLKRVIIRCRGLILVPSRDLARQVHSIISILCDAVGLKSCVLAGEMSLEKEASMLIGKQHNNNHFSKVDIIVATPGRLLDHVEKTKGFTLQHLACLVVDEADRMLSQAYNDWLDRIYRAVFVADENELLKEPEVRVSEEEVIIPEQITRRSNPTKSICVFDFLQQDERRLRRILCSATLTGNPQKLAALSLWNPLLIDSAHAMAAMSTSTETMHAEQKLPATLVELAYRVTQNTKPLGLLFVISSLLEKDSVSRILTFVSSVERANRVHSMLSFAFGGNTVSLISSELTRQQRTEALQKFVLRKTRILVASDLAARGIDVPSLEYVLSYDVPTHVTTYVHRVGRTARAGQKGTSIVLLQREQFTKFNSIKRMLNSPSLNVENIQNEDITRFAQKFQQWKEKTGASDKDMQDEDETKL